MKKAILTLIGLSIGFITGYLYSKHEFNGNSEDIISKEISLLKKYEHIPSCDEIKNNIDIAVNNSSNSEIIHWYFSSTNNTVKKVIITPDIFVAYEESEADCE
jgi:hypothetical protein